MKRPVLRHRLLQNIRLLATWAVLTFAAKVLAGDPRPPSGESELRFWLGNMLVDHGYTPVETGEASGLSAEVIAASLQRYKFPGAPPAHDPAAAVKVLPYPGGRHPRLGFFDGAVDPQRDTKLSVFTPWDVKSYVVVDVPEAIWSNLGLTYLAHKHIDTIWTKQGMAMEKLEWSRRADGSLASERRLTISMTRRANTFCLAATS